MTVNLVIKMKNTDDKSENESGIQLEKGLKVAVF